MTLHTLLATTESVFPLASHQGALVECHLPHWTGGQRQDTYYHGATRVPVPVLYPTLPAVYVAPPYPMHVVSLNASVALVRLAHPGGTMKTRYDYDDHVRAIAGPTLDQQERMTELRRLAIALICTGALAGLLLLTIAIVQIVTGEAR